MKDYVIGVLLVLLAVLFISALPMSRSAAHSILEDNGTLTLEEHSMTYQMYESPSTLELEALVVYSSMYEGVTINISN